MIATYTILVLIAIYILLQSGIVTVFCWKLNRYHRAAVADQALPPVAVVLSVRGPDPALAATIRGLLAQDYPNFLIHIVLDSDRDGARQLIESILAESPADNIQWTLLRNRRSVCSLKCSALIQAVEDLERDYEVLAFIDGDSCPHPTWLRDLVLPLADSAIGVTTGNRWYTPRIGQWGSMVRYFWNSAAVVQVWLNKIVWAGSMAMRVSVIREIGLLDAWSRALSVDATIYRQLRGSGYRVHFVPGVMLLNSEEITLPRFTQWVQRQLVAAKSCKPGWGIVMLHANCLLAYQLAPILLAIWGVLTGHTAVSLLCAVGLGSLWLSNLYSAAVLEWFVRRTARASSRDGAWISIPRQLKLGPAMILTNLVYPYVLARALFRRRVSWRGVEYLVRGPGDVRMLSYHPFREELGIDSVRSVI